MANLFKQTQIKKWDKKIMQTRKQCLEDIAKNYIKTGEFKVTDCSLRMFSKDYSYHSGYECGDTNIAEDIFANLGTKQFVKGFKYHKPDYAGESWYEIFVSTDKV